MAKQSKRTKKFNSTGGVKGRLLKGTITKKGQLKRKGNKRTKTEDDGANSKNDANLQSYSQELRQKREDADFTSKSNLGDLDMESFFETFADGVPAEDDVQGTEMDDDDDDDDDDDEDSVTQTKSKPKSKTKPKPKAKLQAQKEDEDSDSDSEMEDVQEAERKMKEEMGNLQDNDPEYRQFLQENDQELLDHRNQDEEDDEIDERVMTKKGTSDEPDSQAAVVSLTQLTPAFLEKLEKGTFDNHGVKVLKKFVAAFNSACHVTDTEDDQEKAHNTKYQIDSSEVFDRLMVLSLTRLHEEFHYHLLGEGSKGKTPVQKTKKGKEEATPEADEEEEADFVVEPDKPINPKLLEKSKKWNDIKPILFTFLKAVMHILSEAKDPDLVVFVLKSLSDYVPYMTAFPHLAESMLKTLTSLWSAPIDSSEDYQVVRLHAFLRIRQLAMTQPFPLIEECLKKLYLAYAQRAKFATASSVTSVLPTLTFMGNCVVELYSLDYHSSYQHAFIYIRQLALHLRTAMQKKTTEAMGVVYCWQYLHCLKLWVAVLTEACQSNDGMGANGEEQLLRSLLFPLSQVILGTVRLIPSTRYLPLRLHCVRLLQQLAAAAEVFLPTTSILLDVFDLKELSQAPKKVTKSNVQPMALTLRLRADNPLRTMEELEMCISEVFVLLNREVDLYQYSAGFPEFSVRICQRLRKYSKETRNSRWRAYAKGCIDLCDRYSKRAMNERAKLNDVAPKDVKQLEVLKPVNTPSMGERFKQSMEKEKRLEAASRPIQKTATSKKIEIDAGADGGDGSGKKKRKRTKKKKSNGPAGKLDEGALNQADEVEEGIHWSDEE